MLRQKKKSHVNFHSHCLLPDGGGTRVDPFGPHSLLTVESRLSTLDAWELIRPPVEVVFMLDSSGWRFMNKRKKQMETNKASCGTNKLVLCHFCTSRRHLWKKNLAFYRSELK